MKVKCVLCGKEEEINKLHKDFRKLKANPSAAYFCETCALKLSSSASKENKVLGKK